MLAEPNQSAKLSDSSRSNREPIILTIECDSWPKQYCIPSYRMSCEPIIKLGEIFNLDLESRPSFRFRPGELPILISIPHNGSAIPPSIADTMTIAGRSSRDTDWFLMRFMICGNRNGSVFWWRSIRDTLSI